MEIKEVRLTLFMELYEKEFGVTLSRSEAYEKASLVLQYVLMGIKPLAKADEDGITDMSNESK